MQKSYCKYPFIAGCVVGGLIALSLIWCFIRCCMCGYRCCCCGGRRYKNRQVHNPPLEPYPPIGGHGGGGGMGGMGGAAVIGSGVPMAPPGGSGFGQQQTGITAANKAPQYAYFEASSGRSANPDDLPTMPSWQGAKTEKVEDPDAAKDAVELTSVNNNKQFAPLRDENRSPAPSYGPRRPVSPYDNGSHLNNNIGGNGYGNNNNNNGYNNNNYNNNNINNNIHDNQNQGYGGIGGYAASSNGGYERHHTPAPQYPLDDNNSSHIQLPQEPNWQNNNNNNFNQPPPAPIQRSYTPYSPDHNAGAIAGGGAAAVAGGIGGAYGGYNDHNNNNNNRWQQGGNDYQQQQQGRLSPAQVSPGYPQPGYGGFQQPQQPQQQPQQQYQQQQEQTTYYELPSPEPQFYGGGNNNNHNRMPSTPGGHPPAKEWTAL